MIMEEEKKILICTNCKNPIPMEPNIDDPTLEPLDADTQVKCPLCGYEGFPEEISEKEYKKSNEENLVLFPFTTFPSLLWLFFSSI